MKWYIDFSGWCEIEADTKEEVMKKFWDCVMDDKPLPTNYYNIEGVEPKENVK